MCNKINFKIYSKKKVIYFLLSFLWYILIKIKFSLFLYIKFFYFFIYLIFKNKDRNFLYYN